LDAGAVTARTGAFTSTDHGVPSLSLSASVIDGIAFLERRDEPHQHHVIATGLELDRLAGRQRELVDRGHAHHAAVHRHPVDLDHLRGRRRCADERRVRGGAQLHERPGGLLRRHHAAHPRVDDGHLGEDRGREERGGDEGKATRAIHGHCAGTRSGILPSACRAAGGPNSLARVPRPFLDPRQEMPRWPLIPQPLGARLPLHPHP